MLVQQAIFSSGRSHQREGFHLVSRSAGLSKIDAQLLVRRLPWCDALAPTDRQPTGICYGEFGDDSICIMRTMRLSGGPVSRGLTGPEGAQLLTHCFVVPREVFERFGNNPFAILRAVAASGYLLSHEPAGGKLQAIRLAGRAAAVDHILLGNLARYPGPATLAGLVHQALERGRLILVGPYAEELLSGLISVLPIEERAGFSFSIGLRPSLRRPVRIAAVPESSLPIERFARQCRCTVLKISELWRIDYRGNAWAKTVAEALEDLEFSRLADQVVAPAAELVGELFTAACGRARQSGDAWETRSATAPVAVCRTASLAISTTAQSDQTIGGGTAVAVLAEARAEAPRSATPGRSTNGRDHNHFVNGDFASSDLASSDLASSDLDSSDFDRSDLDNGDFADGPAVAADAARGSTNGRTAPAARSHDRVPLRHDAVGNDPASLEMLEQLDDLVYEAVAGRPGAFEQLTDFWPQALAALEGDALVESREQYLRYALGLWNQGDTAGIQDPQRAMGALDVLCLLFPEDEF